MTAPSEILFGGTINSTNLTEMARAIGVDVSTVGRWKKDPDRILFGDLKMIVRLKGLSDRQILNLFGRGSTYETRD